MSSALRSAFLVSVWLLATAAPALASGGDEGGNPWVEFMWEALNLALLAQAVARGLIPGGAALAEQRLP